MLFIFSKGLLQRGFQLGPGLRVARLDGIHHMAAFIRFHCCQVSAAGSRGGQWQTYANIHAQGGGFRWPAVLDVDHRESITAGQADGSIGRAGEFIQIGFG